MNNNRNNNISRETFGEISHGLNKLFSGFSGIFQGSSKPKKITINRRYDEDTTSKVYLTKRGDKISKIPVNVKLEEKPFCLALLNEINTTEKLDLAALKALINDLNKPQEIEIKVTEINPKDDKDLWDVSQYNKQGLKHLIRKSLSICLKQGFEIEYLGFEQGCLSIIIILKAVVNAVVSIVPAIVTFITNYDRIKENISLLKQDIAELKKKLLEFHQKVEKSIANTIEKISRWFNNDGWDFSAI